MTKAPTNTARKVIDNGLGEVTRRLEVYEADGATLWQDGLVDRLQGGGINVTYGNNERRTFDVTLKNTDNLLRSRPSGFWYDKVIKVFRGVEWYGDMVQPEAVVIEAVGGQPAAFRLAGLVAQAGITKTTVRLDVPSVGELMQYDVIVSNTGTAASGQALTLKELFDAGKSIITISAGNTTSVLPFVTTTSSVSETLGISQPAVATDLSPGWTTESHGIVTGPIPTALQGSATIVSRWQLASSAYVITASVATNINGGKWFDLHLPSVTGTNTLRLFANAISWIRGIGKVSEWSSQIGEFVIDNIANDYYPSSVKVTGRDYTKKCMNSKIESAMTFASGTSIHTLITALAANSGISKLRLAYMPETLSSAMTFDRGVPRWDIMREAATTNGYEIYFDQEGFLVTRKFLDPTLGTESNVFQTGVDGNLASIARSVSDSRIYNHICVYGDPASGETRFPYFGEAINTEPQSPTRVGKIGDRFYSYASTFFSSQQQTQEYAERLLSLHALESFELNFSAINYPWMEVGEIARVVDPRAVETDPTKYLVDTATLPLTLGPMSFTGKRVTMVG